MMIRRTPTASFLLLFLSVGSSQAADLSLDASVDSEGGRAEAKSTNKKGQSDEKSQSELPPLGSEMPYLERYKPERGAWELGLFGGVSFPSKRHELYEPGRSSSQQGFSPAGIIGARVGYFPLTFLGAEFEGMAMPTAAKDDSSAGMWSARGHLVAQLPGHSVVPFVLAGGGALGAASEAMGSDVDPALSLGAGVKVALDEHLSLRFDVRDVLSQKFSASQGALTHHPEVLFGITFTPSRQKPDLDRDGYNDFRDSCPRVFGELAGCPAPDGDKDGVPDKEDKCPEVASSHPSGCPDRDGDGVADGADRCPDAPGDSELGCPEKVCEAPDTDGDGVPDAGDKCPDVAAKTADGCPASDRDDDGVPDASDKCPDESETKNGFRDSDGCPDAVPEEVKRFDGVMDGIVFEHGSATIAPSSLPRLEATQEIMTEYPSLHIEISGHTDSTGEEEHNQKLSLERADAVRRFLTEAGIESSRIETRGLGSRSPVADNSTATGRNKNRRIEFHLVRE